MVVNILLNSVKNRPTVSKNEYDEIVTAFEQEIQQGQQTFITREVEKLQSLGICGSAVRPNLNENQEWKEEQNKIRYAINIKVEIIRKKFEQLTKQ